ncbi:heme/hemin ABC transporter substrate-binding protein [Piscinibacter sakaiensis]|uniref:Periplasmic hemin-binding protein n=1 Tax=Piscinibacter sakaiensis TaxID=1547922 RepID=A0A0K8P630_PISS1|nr:ABC transporter substrate-binding protein [Piscinibacter sakaiensis]GAP38056.1 periplasmic hemin-binding protein [Piscinibacter sakaiensis]
MHGLLNGRAWSGSARRRRILLAALALPAASLRAQPPRQRIVTVGGALTEIVYALGAEAALVGVDTTSLYPAAAQRLPSVGYARALSAEGVLSLAPTLLLHSQEAGPPAVLSQLAAARLPMERLDLDHRIEGLLAAARRVGRLTGHADAGERLATRLEAEFGQALSRVAARRGGAAPPRVLFVLSHSLAQVRIAGRDTAADAMIGLAGGRNALGDATGYKPLSPEAAIAAAPEVILCTEQGLQAAGGIDGLLQAPGLAATPAGRARRVVAMDALLLLGFGPRLPQAVATLADRLVGS